MKENKMSVTQKEEVSLRLGLSTGDMPHKCYFHEVIALKGVNTARDLYPFHMK